MTCLWLLVLEEKIMFVVVYQFAVKPEHESQFVKAWLNTTKGITLHKGGLGSRLHRDKAGSFIAYAQWPDEYTFQAAKKIFMSEEYEKHRQTMQTCLDVKQTRILHEMNVAIDYLQPFSSSQNTPLGN